jgi:peptide/nickel transport system substrate-binding protein
MTKNRTIAIALFLLFIMLLGQGVIATRAQTSPLQQTSTGVTLHVGLTVEPDTFNPYTGVLAIDDFFLHSFYDQLYVEGLDYNMHPRLATNYTVSPNGTVWTVSIVHNATFSDGVPLTARDVKLTYDLAGLPEVDHTEVVDNYTIRFYLTGPYFTDWVLRNVFANDGADILPQHIWGNVSDVYSFSNQQAIGTGPWILDTWVRGQYIKMRANPNYFLVDERPKIDYVILDIIPSLDTQVLSLEGGTLDMIHGLDSSYVATLLNVPNINMTILPQLRSNFLVFNLNRYPTNVEEFRHALAYALDPHDLVHNALFGFGIPGQQGWVTPGEPLFYNANITQYAYNLTAANQILDNLGWKTGSDGVRVTSNGTRLEFKILVPSETPSWLRSANFIQSQFAQIGVKLDILTETTTTVVSQAKSGQFSMAMTGWYSISVQPAVDMAYQFLPGGFNNLAGYNSSAFNKLYQQMRVATSLADYKNDIFQMEKVLSDELPILLYSWTPSIDAYRTDKFQGWVTPVLADDILQGLLNWYSLGNLQTVSASETMVQSTTQQVTAATTAPDYTWWIVGLVIVVAVAIVAVATRRKKKS